VRVGDVTLTSPTPVTQPFGRGQFFDLTDEQRLTLPSFEPFAAGGRAADEVHLQLSDAWEAAGDAAKSESHMLSAVAARPGAWTLWNRLGGMRTRAADYDGARKAFERAAGLAPAGTQTVAENLAALLFHEGELAEALAAYEAIPGPLSGATSASNLATLYFFNERFADAERLFRQAVRLEPRGARWRRNLADTLLRLRKTDEARQEYAQALRLVEEQLALTPGDSDLLVQRTLYLARVTRCAEALAAADELGRDLARSAQLLHDLALAPALCNRPEQAIARLRDAVALGFTAERLTTEDELAALRGRSDYEALVGPSHR